MLTNPVFAQLNDINKFFQIDSFSQYILSKSKYNFKPRTELIFVNQKIAFPLQFVKVTR